MASEARLRARSRDAVVGGLVAAPTLVWMTLVGAEGEGRWPWVGFVILAVVPFLVLLLPPAQDRLRALVAGRAWRAAGAVAAVAGYGAILSIATGGSRWYNVVLWPICLAAAAAAVGTDSETEVPPGRLLLMSLGVWALAGVWDSKLQIRAPGDLDFALTYFASLGVALFLLRVVRPLRSLDVGLGLSGRDLLRALAGVAALVLVALPAGYAIGFLRFNLRWNGPAYAAGRLFGLTLFVALPEEVLFRGIWQEALSRRLGGPAGWIIGSVLFGLTHIVKRAPPLNWRYAILATLAGLAYGWVYQRTGRVAAAAVTHGLVDWIWSTFLLLP